MRNTNSTFDKQTSIANYFKIIFLSSLILMLGGIIISMIDEGNKSPIDRPQIKINSETAELFSHDTLQKTNVVYPEINGKVK